MIENPRTLDSVRALLASATQADGVAPLSEQFLLGLDDARLGHAHLLREADGGEVVGVLAVDTTGEGSVAEMAVAPDARRRGVGSALLADAAARFGAPGEGLQVWAHGNLPAARAFARAHGLRAGRRLLVMGVGGDALRAAAREPETDLEVLDYAQSVGRFGADVVDAAWVRVNNEAFSWHPEQGGWDVARLCRGREAEWFDPADVILFWDGDRLAGFHWTKWHTEEEPNFGEVYVVGLADAYRGRGLGTPLLNAGLRRLAERGAARVILYVESDNGPAVAAYEKLGFTVVEEHAVYQK